MPTTSTAQPDAAPLQQRLTILTIGVADLPRMRAFYEEQFGWRPEAANPDIVFFRLNGFLLALFGNRALAEDAGVEAQNPRLRGFTLAYNVRTEAEVDTLFDALEGRGVRIVKRPEKTFFGGYSGYVSDVEGNLWEIASNPYVELDADGGVVTHRDIQHLG